MESRLVCAEDDKKEGNSWKGVGIRESLELFEVSERLPKRRETRWRR